MSPRTRQWNQMPVSDPISTSPITAAVGAMKASAAILRRHAVQARNTVPGGGCTTTRCGSGIRQLAGTDTGMQPQHQGDVLHGRARRPFAQVVQPRDQHRLAVFLVGVDIKFQPVGVVQRLGLQLAVGRRAASPAPDRSRRSAPPGRRADRRPSVCRAGCPGAAAPRPACPCGNARPRGRRSAGASGRRRAASPARCLCSRPRP